MSARSMSQGSGKDPTHAKGPELGFRDLECGGAAQVCLTNDGRVSRWNYQAEKIFGLKSSEAIGKTWEQLGLGNLPFAGSLKGKIFEEEANLRSFDGSVFKSRIRARTLATEVSDLTEPGTLVSIEKISSSPNHDELKRSQESLAFMISVVKDYAIFALDSSGTVTTWNEGAKALKGYSSDEIVGKHFSLFHTPADVKRNHPGEELEIASREGRFQEEGWRVRKDGSQFWADVTLTAIHGPTGEVVGYLKVTRDLTERRKAEELLRRSNDIFNHMVAAVKDYAIFLLDDNGKILTWNAGAERFNGYSASEIIGKHFSIFYPEELVLRKHPEDELRTARERGHYEEEGWRVKKDGSEFWSRITITSIYNENGELTGFVKVTQDLTQQRQIEAEIRRARDEAVQSSQLKSQFVANVSHEIRTPMAGIIGMAELLSSDPGLDEDQKELADHLLQSGKRLLVVLNDILDFSKLEAGKTTVESVPFCPASLCQEVLDIFLLSLGEKKIDMELLIHPDIPDALVGDEVKLRQILSNLLSNAIKFTTEGYIKLSVEPAAAHQDDAFKHILFSVADTGIGISEDQQKLLFQPFTQADGSTKRKFGGTGLGLSICKGYVQLMNGWIECESKLGEGSVFSFVLPFACDESSCLRKGQS